MLLVSRKGSLVVTAVVDIALGAHPVRAKDVAGRHGLHERSLEPELQVLVRHRILKGMRGPRGGYRLAREPREISVGEILRAVGTMEASDDFPAADSALLSRIVLPALSQAESELSGELARITVEDLTRSAEGLHLQQSA